MINRNISNNNYADDEEKMDVELVDSSSSTTTVALVDHDIMKKMSTEIENTYVCLTWEATEKAPAEQKTDRQAVQRAVQHPAKRRNSN